MLRTSKPKTARSKRHLESTEAKAIENEKQAIFVRGSQVSEKVKTVMKDLYALKAPNAINFSKKNPIHPFESQGLQSLSFFSQKNDASLFVVGQHSKKRPDNLVFARCFAGEVMDMVEMGVESVVGMKDIKTPKSTPGHRQLMVFQSPLFSTHPTYQLIKSMLLDFFNGHALESIPLMGLEGVICVSAGPMASTSDAAPDAKEVLPLVHLRVFTLKLLATPTRLPKVQLIPMGPSIDFSIRRTQFGAPEILSLAYKRPKLDKKDVEKGLGKKRKNIETDDMGDLVGRIHLGKQDLSNLQVRKMKGLKDGKRAKVAQNGDEEATGSGAGGGEGRGREQRASKAAAKAAAATVHGGREDDDAMSE